MEGYSVLTTNKNRNTSLKLCVYLFCILGLLFSSPKNTTSYAATRNDLGFPFPDCQNWYVFQGYNSLHQGQFLYAFDLVKDNRWDALDITGGASIVAAATGRVYGTPYQINGPNGINWGKGFKMILDDGMILEYDHLMNLPSYLVNNTVITKGTEVGKVFNGKPGGVNHLHFQTFPTEALNFGLWHYPSTGPSDGNGTWSGTKIASPCVPAFNYEYVGQSYSDLTLRQPEMLYFQLRNTGLNTWNRDVTQGCAIRLGTGEPGRTDGYRGENHTSPFYQAGTYGWESNGRVLMEEASVPPGGVATFRFQANLPSVEGLIQEYWTPVVEGVGCAVPQWLSSIGIHVNITVSLSPTPSTTVTPSPTSMTPSPTPSTTVTPSPTSMTPSPTPSTTVTPSPTSITPSPTPVTSRYSVYLPMIQR